MKSDSVCLLLTAHVRSHCERQYDHPFRCNALLPLAPLVPRGVPVPVPVPVRAWYRWDHASLTLDRTRNLDRTTQLFVMMKENACNASTMKRRTRAMSSSLPETSQPYQLHG